MFWLLFRLVSKVKWVKILMFDSCFCCCMNKNSFFCFTIFTCDQQDLKLLWFFNTVSCFKFLEHWFNAISTCIGTCFVEKSIDSLPIFNLRFCLFLCFRIGKDDYIWILIIGDARRRERFFESDLCFPMSSWLYLDLFCFEFCQEVFL